MGKKFKYRPGSRVKGVPAAVVGKSLEEIRKEHGKLTPPLILQEAEDEDHELHPVFTWDNDKAGHEYRLIEARQLIRAVCVVYEERPDEAPRAVYVHVPDVDEGQYSPMEVVARNADQFELALGGLRGKLLGAKRSCDELLHFADDQKKQKKVKTIKRHMHRVVQAARVG